MKNQALSLLSAALTVLISPLSPAALSGENLEYSSYMRAGSGTNGKGGAQECFNNLGAPTNEFRLGNECGFYGEAAFTAYVKKNVSATDSYFYSQIRFSFFPQGYRLYDGESFANRGLNLSEAFVAAGNWDDFQAQFWIGRRFYRDIDAYIDDWYYFADMSGVGAGIEKINLGLGKLAIANILQGSDTMTDKGHAQLQVLDLRWSDIDLTAHEKLHFWGALGSSPGGSTSSGEVTQSTHGYLGSVRLHSFWNGGFNDLALFYGSGDLQSLNLYSSIPATNDSLNRAHRTRIVENLATELEPKWGLLFVAAADQADLGTSQYSRFSWWSLAARPVYYFNDHYQLAVEVGHSEVRQDSELNNNSVPVGTRQLTRITIAPQLSMGHSIWARPVMRIFYTMSLWNQANQADIAASGAPSFAGSLSGGGVGYQAEIWF